MFNHEAQERHEGFWGEVLDFYCGAFGVAGIICSLFTEAVG